MSKKVVALILGNFRLTVLLQVSKGEITLSPIDFKIFPMSVKFQQNSDTTYKKEWGTHKTIIDVPLASSASLHEKEERESEKDMVYAQVEYYISTMTGEDTHSPDSTELK